MSTKIDPVNAGAEYLMSEDGVVSRRFAGDEAVIGKYSGGGLTLNPEAAKYRRWAVQWLTEKGLAVNSVSIEGKEGPKKDAPPRPPMHPKQGDKTPALVDWMEEHSFEEFKATFGVLGPKNKKTGLYPATRKCHLTEKIEGGSLETNTLSWDDDDGTVRKEAE